MDAALIGVGVVLPAATTDQKRLDDLNNFTADEMRDISLRGVELRLEHGPEDTDVVGEVLGDMMDDEGRKLVSFRVAALPAAGDFNSRYKASLLHHKLAEGIIPDLSFNHIPVVDEEKGERRYVPIEVSLTERGRKQGCQILSLRPETPMERSLWESQQITSRYLSRSTSTLAPANNPTKKEL